MVSKIVCKVMAVAAIILTIPTTIEAQIKFQEVKFEEAEQEISKGNAPYIIYFAAAWCPSCKMMEETTFKDAKLGDRINTNFIAYKVDIDKPGGKNWAANYAIYTLPTTLLYDANGKLIKRVEKPITTSQFLALTENYQIKKSFINLIVKAPIKRKILKKDKAYIPSEYRARAITTSFSPNSKEYQLFNKNKKIIDFLKLEHPVQNGQQYIVQIGKYRNIRTVERLVQQIQNRLDYPVKVLIEKEGNTPVQIVYLGEFKTQKAAIAANQNLSNIQKKGVVRKF